MIKKSAQLAEPEINFFSINIFLTFNNSIESKVKNSSK